MTTETVFVSADPNPPDRSRWFWWLMSEGTWTAPEYNNGQPYLPNTKNQFLRNTYWWLRNPAGRLMGHVFGVQGRDRYVTGPAPATLVTWADVGQRGWKWAITRCGWLRLPFVSYYGICEFYLGWRPHDGALGFKLVNASRGETND